MADAGSSAAHSEEYMDVIDEDELMLHEGSSRVDAFGARPDPSGPVQRVGKRKAQDDEDEDEDAEEDEDDDAIKVDKVVGTGDGSGDGDDDDAAN